MRIIKSRRRGWESEIEGRVRWNCVRVRILMWQDLEKAKITLEGLAVSLYYRCEFYHLTIILTITM
jgi:hypothetical protein